MPDPLILQVSGTVDDRGAVPLLVLHERLEGHDTFLSGHLELDGAVRVPVRILTFDDVTVLHPTAPISLAQGEWTGHLHLRHGQRARDFPEDLTVAARTERRALEALDEAEARYAVTFLTEATTAEIRAARIKAIISALPTISGDLA